VESVKRKAERGERRAEREKIKDIPIAIGRKKIEGKGKC
jgi:hypothetical protein